MDAATLPGLELPTLSLSDFALHHTWSIRCLAPFVNPLVFHKGCAGVEDEISRFVRDNRAEWEQTVENEGTFVRLFWGEQDFSNKLVVTSGRKKRKRMEDDVAHTCSGKVGKSDNTQALEIENDDSATQNLAQRHLLIDIRLEDQPSAQLIFCFPKFSKDACNSGAGQIGIKKFDFVLVRGSTASLQATFRWLETSTGTSVAKSPFNPSCSDIAQAMTLWTSEHLEWTSSRPFVAKQQDNANTNENESAGVGDEVNDAHEASKPMTLTYSIPSGSSISGLETVSLIVPPVAMLRLCKDIISFRQNQEVLHKSNILNVDEKMPPKKATDTIPVVSALQHFMNETFHINVEKFTLIRASSPAAVLGRDGRCKPIHAHLLDNILREIRFMTKLKLA